MHEATGMNLKYAEMVKVGERITNIERLFNLREGYTRKEDDLPERFLEPLHEGQSKGQTFDAARMLDNYYKLRGWDDQGVPTKEKLRSLSLA
jgi:aldehyde:ferredoxin oxidoreductase